MAFNIITRMGQKEVLSYFECNSVVGGRQADLSISIINTHFDTGTVIFG